MCKLKKNKGFGLAEVICSLAVISILLTSVYKIEMIDYKLEIYNTKMNNYIEILEGVKSDILCNYEYKEIKNILGKNKTKKLYIDEKNLNLDKLKYKDFINLANERSNKNHPYLEIVLNDNDDNVIKIDLNIITKLLDKDKIIKISFYKGDY